MEISEVTTRKICWVNSVQSRLRHSRHSRQPRVIFRNFTVPQLYVPFFFSASPPFTYPPPSFGRPVPHLCLYSPPANGNIGLIKYTLSHGQCANSVIVGVAPQYRVVGENDLVLGLMRPLIEQSADVNVYKGEFALYLLSQWGRLSGVIFGLSIVSYSRVIAVLLCCVMPPSVMTSEDPCISSTAFHHSPT